MSRSCAVGSFQGFTTTTHSRRTSSSTRSSGLQLIMMPYGDVCLLSRVLRAISTGKISSSETTKCSDRKGSPAGVRDSRNASNFFALSLQVE